MKVGMFYPDLNNFEGVNNKVEYLGNNTGNIAFWTSLTRLIDIERIPYDYKEKGISLNDYDKIITTDLIWIRQGDYNEFLERLLEETDTAIIPISVGLQANDFCIDFKLSDRMVKLLMSISERATIGVRGEYTAYILSKHGINNYEIIGCPSLYYWNNKDLRIVDNVLYPNNVVANFKTFYGRMTQKEKQFMAYLADFDASFIEQTSLIMTNDHTCDNEYYKYVNNWLLKNSHLYYSVNDWKKETALYDFSMGARFHGNVISLWNNIKSLFIITDSRTRELTAHFNLPSIDMEKFDRSKDLKYYYELANYDNFNSMYALRYFEFVNFLNKNGLSISEKAEPKQFAQSNNEKMHYIASLYC
ncbi:polysaccharide pyruvyl transferase family protein [Pseudobutyrivibrio sp. LB2011]|uniref:polysaccharide pyruvyl transferase family protein n=1 Tax=Pseudobutyrivibrio sp. LB2011 TaxID=1408312 RepID=UPI0005D17100|nr:polysaccharide pyruvyl transferase family protein [Pseudobutyrivibrio sp. LB2011]